MGHIKSKCFYDFAMPVLIQRAPERVNNDGPKGDINLLLYQSFKGKQHLRGEFVLLCALFDVPDNSEHLCTFLNVTVQTKYCLNTCRYMPDKKITSWFSLPV